MRYTRLLNGGKRGIIRVALVLLVLCLLWGCQPGPPPKGLEPLAPERAEKVAQSMAPAEQGLENWSELRPGLKGSLEYVRSKREQGAAPTKVYGRSIPWGELERTLERMLELLPRLEREGPSLLGRHFRFYRLRPDPLFTGYFEPTLRASLTKRPGYDVPIYGVPEDLQVADLGRFHPRWEGESLVYRIEEGRIEPYFSREAIRENGDFRDKAPVLAWAKDRVEVFILQIQGSGKLKLPDGRIVHVGYAAKNGRPYRSLGRILGERGYLDSSSLDMWSISRFLEDNPDMLPEVLDVNPSFVFFQLREDGPFGAMNKKLTPMASLATDPSVIPLGTPLVYQVRLPERDAEDTLPITGLGMAQDVGGAITNHHVDLFCGSSDEAKYRAGHLKDKGSVYLLLAR
ncbi:MAG: murein transglycosylase A [Desulfohalobiaceae bacterium]|nr:murein transglycosylase A [Desulfohalobiaceae bacterium]